MGSLPPTGSPSAAPICGLHVSDLASIVRFIADDFRPAWTEALLRSELSRNVTASLAVLDPFDDRQGKRSVVAFMLYVLVADEAHVTVIATHPEHRRKGYAKLLVQTMLRTPGLQQAFLEVRPSNTPAAALYLSLGFVDFDRRKKYYSDGEDALIMRWTRVAD